MVLVSHLGLARHIDAFCLVYRYVMLFVIRYSLFCTDSCMHYTYLRYKRSSRPRSLRSLGIRDAIDTYCLVGWHIIPQLNRLRSYIGFRSYLFCFSST